MESASKLFGSENKSAVATTVVMETSKGTIELTLFSDKAPASVANFLQYVNDGFYDGTQFHRVIDGFMIQGGGFTAELSKKPTRGPINNEADNGLLNTTGTIAMARTNAPHSATSQFFINVADNAFLNHRGKAGNQWGYAVFGEVSKGMDVVEAIKAVPTQTRSGYANVPIEPVLITKVQIKP
ncbi:MAG: peptidyl-prolyl cis-trans isomerase [Pseudomonadales bacterium]|nr:peptidyl-prolyl cis-trans isomerase [Pseudomonadales bacterium]